MRACCVYSNQNVYTWDFYFIFKTEAKALPHPLIKEFGVAFTRKAKENITRSLLFRHDLTQVLCTRNYPKIDVALDV